MSQVTNFLAPALAPKFLVLYAFVLSAIAIHFRGRVRHRFLRQLTDHSTLLAPVNSLLYLFSAVPNKPRVPVERFPELKLLTDNWQTFREEGMALYRAGHVKASKEYDDLGFNSFFRRGWKRFYLSWYGQPHPSAVQFCPRSVEILRRAPTVKAAMFALLPDGGKLMAHRDPYAGSLRFHLGLVTPNSEKCRIYIDGEPYSWRDGEAIVFDETYIHSAINESGMDRLILFADVERPMAFAPARWLNRFFARTVMRATETKNEEGERVGALNKAFAFVYRGRVRMKALKKSNRKLYYAIKYVTLGGLLAAFVVWA
jgi:beta-hydroxylase